MYINNIYFILYYYLTTCIGHFCDHHYGVTQ